MYRVHRCIFSLWKSLALGACAWPDELLGVALNAGRLGGHHQQYKVGLTYNLPSSYSLLNIILLDNECCLPLLKRLHAPLALQGSVQVLFSLILSDHRSIRSYSYAHVALAVKRTRALD